VFEGDVLKAAAAGTDINEVSSGMADCKRAHRPCPLALGAGAGENKIVALERKLNLYGYPTSQTGRRRQPPKMWTRLKLTLAERAASLP
jgi:hypothetical protein